MLSLASIFILTLFAVLPGPDISSPVKLDKLTQPLYTALATCKKRVPYPVILGKPAELWVPEELLSHKARKAFGY